jgi:hypothetical protein
MARGSLVAVTYPVDGDFVQINTSVLDGLAEVAFLDGRPDAEFRDTCVRPTCSSGGTWARNCRPAPCRPRPVSG